MYLEVGPLGGDYKSKQNILTFKALTSDSVW